MNDMSDREVVASFVDMPNVALSHMNSQRDSFTAANVYLCDAGILQVYSQLRPIPKLPKLSTRLACQKSHWPFKGSSLQRVRKSNRAPTMKRKASNPLHPSPKMTPSSWFTTSEQTDFAPAIDLTSSRKTSKTRHCSSFELIYRHS
jgi:hypothetical protein